MKRRSLKATAPTARHGSSASPYLKRNKKPAHYSWGNTWQLDPAYYQSAAADPAGHPDRVASGFIANQIKKRIEANASD
jgi:hypothetical protein